MRGSVRRGLTVAMMLLCAAALAAQDIPPPVSFFFIAGDIWHFHFRLAHPEAVREIRFRSKSDGDGAWSSAARELDPVTHEPSPVTSVDLPFTWARPGRQKIEVALVGKAGKVSGTYLLELDLEAEAIALAKEELGDAPNGWAGFADRESWKETLLSFHWPFRHHNALREIRYSLDSCDLGQRIPMHSKPGFFGPEWEGEEYLRVPKSVSYACAQLVFRDGTTHGPLRIEHVTGSEPPPDPTP